MKGTWLLSIRDNWVDYAYVGAETGSFSTPFSSLTHALGAVGPASVVKFKPHDGNDHFSATMPVILQAPLAPVTIR